MITSRDNDTLKLVRKLLGQRKHRDESGPLRRRGGGSRRGRSRQRGSSPCTSSSPVRRSTSRCSPASRRCRIPLARSASTAAPTSRRGVRDTCLALWRLADPGNVGTLIRTADAFGAGIALSDGCADPLSPKALRASVGAIFRVPLVALGATPPGRRRSRSSPTAATPLADVDLAPPVTFLLGAERAGLPDELVTTSHKASDPAPG